MEPNKIAIRRLVELALAAAALYNLFADRYIEDRDFWIALKDEEIQNTRLLKQIEIDQSEAPDGVSFVSPVSGDVVNLMIEQIHTFLNDIDTQVKSRKEACFIALQLEQSAGEFHYQAMADERRGSDLARNLLSCYPHLMHLFMPGYTADVIAHNGILDEG
ncbi:MAG: hypothetical protein V2B19_27130 [Pseudomonadota bacterium]